jgi:hypothetical protein
MGHRHALCLAVVAPVAPHALAAHCSKGNSLVSALWVGEKSRISKLARLSFLKHIDTKRVVKILKRKGARKMDTTDRISQKK